MNVGNKLQQLAGAVAFRQHCPEKYGQHLISSHMNSFANFMRICVG